MNWFFTIIFLSVSFSIYYLLGNLALKYFHYQKISPAKSCIAGFIIIFFIQFLIGFPLQVLRISWKIYYVIISTCFLLMLLFLVLSYKNYFQKINIKFISFEKISQHILKYWFLYILVVLFSILSMSNQQPFYSMNYDDPYYIGKMVHLVDTPSLLNENYFNGSINLGPVGIERYFNTYELAYSYFANIFHISIPFFCRATMVIHNYILVVLVYYALAKEYFKDYYAQYSLLFFIIFLVPFGFLNITPYIHMYDGWQFQTAIFYGSSIVRVLSVPIIILFSKDLIIKIDYKKIIFVGIVYISLLSFSTIFIQVGSLMFLSLLFTKLLYLINNNHNKIYYLLLIALLSITCLSMFIPDYLLPSINEGREFFNEYIHNGLFFAYAFIILLCLLILIKLLHNKEFRYLVIIVSFLYFILRVSIFEKLLAVTSINMFFVTLRTVAAVEHMLLFLCGCIFISLIERFKAKQIIPLSLSGCLCIFTCIYFYKNIDNFKQYEYLGSGIDKDGYSISRLRSDQLMIPEIIYKVGDYLNQLDYDNYKVIVAESYQYDYTELDSMGFIMSSNRIELSLKGGCGLSLDENKVIQQYYQGKLNYTDIESIVKNRKIDYILVNNKNQIKELDSLGKIGVLEYKNTDENVFYMYKLR